MTPRLGEIYDKVTEYRKKHPEMTIGAVANHLELPEGSYYLAKRELEGAKRQTKATGANAPRKMAPMVIEAAPIPSGKITVFVGDPETLARIFGV